MTRFLLFSSLCVLVCPAVAAADDLTAARELAEHGYAETAALLLDPISTGVDASYEARLLAGIVHAQRGATVAAREVFAELLAAYPDRSELHDNLAVLEGLDGSAADRAERVLRDRAGNRFRLASPTPGDAPVRIARPLVPALPPPAPAAQPRRVAVEEPVAPPAAAPESSAIRALDFEDGTPGVEPSSIEPPAETERVVYEPLPGDVVAPEPTVPEPSAPEPSVPEPSAPEPSAPEPRGPDETRVEDGDLERVRRQVRLAIDGWAKAWSAQRVEAYLAYYADDFRPEGGVSREAWADQRRERLLAPASIRVWIPDLDVELTAPDRAVARFTQHYESDRYQDVVTKVLELRHEAAGWRIVVERVVP